MAAARLRVFLSLSTRTVTSNSWKLTRGVSSVVGSRDIPRGTLRGRPDASRGQGSLERPLHRPLSFLPWSKEATKPSTESEVVEKVKEEIENLPPNKVFAVAHISGRQFKITQNDLIVINRIQADVGDSITLQKVLLAGSENFTLIGTPLLSQESVNVRATVIEHGRSAKVIVFKKKRRKNYKRKRGHRQDTTVLRINEIHLSSGNIE